MIYIKSFIAGAVTSAIFVLLLLMILLASVSRQGVAVSIDVSRLPHSTLFWAVAIAGFAAGFYPVFRKGLRHKRRNAF